VAITPTTYDRVLTLVRDEHEITYYLLTPGSPIQLSVVGPTELMVNTRLDFAHDMKGSSHGYSIDVSEAGESIARASFEVGRSHVTDYPRRPEIVPGIVKGFRVPIAEGTHALEIHLQDTIAPGVGVRLYLPADDLARGNGRGNGRRNGR
jgi:hypothetical protein